MNGQLFVELLGIGLPLRYDYLLKRNTMDSVNNGPRGQSSASRPPHLSDINLGNEGSGVTNRRGRISGVLAGLVPPFFLRGGTSRHLSAESVATTARLDAALSSEENNDSSQTTVKRGLPARVVSALKQLFRPRPGSSTVSDVHIREVPVQLPPDEFRRLTGQSQPRRTSTETGN